jgi:hypothetical protein
MTKFTIVSFGTADYSRSLEIQKRNSLQFGAYRHVACDVQSPPVVCALSENPALAPHMKGYGYWIWKPYIILDVLDQLDAGDYAIYLDAGVAPVADMKPWFEQLQRNVVSVFAPVPPLALRKFTKRDCFVRMQADTPGFHNAAILSAGIQAYRKDPESIAFLAELMMLMRDPRLLTDGENTLGLPNYEGFIAHRHDQSILSLLAMKRGYPARREPSQYGVWSAEARSAYIASGEAAPDLVNEACPQVLDVHRGRNRNNALIYAWWRMKRKIKLAKRGIIAI